MFETYLGSACWSYTLSSDSVDCVLRRFVYYNVNACIRDILTRFRIIKVTKHLSYLHFILCGLVKTVLFLQGRDPEQAENMVYTVLRQRHMKEAVHLEEQLDRERQAKIAEARAEMADKRGQEREKLQAAFEQELLELVANPMGLSVQELNEQKEALKKKHEVWLNLRPNNNSAIDCGMQL